MASRARQTGGFAKRSNASAKISRQIGWLNHNAGLQKEIMYKDVKDHLGQIGEASALRLLKRLEKSSADVIDPTAFLVDECAKEPERGVEGPDGEGCAASGDEGDAPQGDGDSVEGAPKPKRPRGGRGTRKAREAAGEGREGVLGRVEKRLQWLNENVSFGEALSFERIGESLADMGLTEAMAMLKQLEATAQAEEVRNPNGFVAAAIRRASTSSGTRGGAAPRGPGRTVIKGHLKASSAPRDGFLEKIKKRVAWLNANVGLKSDITWDKVSGPLVDAGEVSFDMLQELEGSASVIRDPTGWLIATARKKLQDAQGGAAPRAGDGEPARAPKRRRGEAEGELSIDAKMDKLEQRLQWLNERIRLASPLRFEVLVPVLADLDLKQAFDILKSFEEKADTIRDPTAYVLSAAKDELRLMQEGDRVPPGPEADKLAQRLNWLNERIRLAAPLRLEVLVPILADLDLKHAFDILKSFEEKADSIRDPTAYVAKAAKDELRKRQEGGAAGGPGPEIRAARPTERAARRPLAIAAGGVAALPPSSEAARLQKRIAWLNSHAVLAEPLVYEEVAADLLGIGYLNALEVLNNLEENGEKVRNPNRYVISGARKAAGGEPPLAAMQAPPQGPGRRPLHAPRDAQPPPRRREAGSDGQKLEQRIAWMNRNLCQKAPLDYGRLAPVLLQMTPDDVHRMLKDFEEGAFGDVRDPTAYIIGIARRVVAGEGPPGRGPARESGRPPSPRPSRADGKGGRPSRGERPSGRGRAGSGPGPGGPIGAIGAGPASRGPALKNLEASSSARDGGDTYYGAQKRQRDDVGGAGADEGDVDLGAKEDQLRARIESLNANGQLQLPLEFEGNVRELLLKVEIGKSMSVLKRLEDIAAEVRDPTGFVVATVGRMCKRTGAPGSRGAGRRSGGKGGGGGSS